MKFKLTVLTLLLLGLVFAGNAFAAQSAVLSLIQQDDTEHIIPDVGAATIGYPVLRLRLTNTGEAVTNLTSLSFTTTNGTNVGASTVITDDGDFTLSLWLDTNKNGVIDPADVLLNSVAEPMLASGVATTVTFDTGTDAQKGLAVGEVKEFIVIANAAATADEDDAVALRVVTGVGNKPFGGIAISLVTSTATTTLNPSDFANIPSFTVGDPLVPGTVTLGASVVLSNANVGNLAKDQVVAAFK